MAEEDHNFLTRVATSWLRPAEVETDWVFDGYTYAQRAYVFRPANKAAKGFHCLVKPASALLNPIIILEGMAQPVREIKIDGEKTKGFQYQIEEKKSTVVWIDTMITHNSTMEINFG